MVSSAKAHLLSDVEWKDGKDEEPKLSILSYLQCFFVSVATILGTGILGLPLMLSHSGFYPFLLTFLISYLMQILGVYFFVELLQICQAALNETLHEVLLNDNDECKETLLMRHHNNENQADHNKLFPIIEKTNEVSDNENEDEEIFESNGNGSASEKMEEINSVKVSGVAMKPNLHIMGKLFLNKWIGYLFNIIIYINFNAILISYVLAGSEAYGQLLHLDYVQVIPIFMWVLTIVVIFGFHFIQPVIAMMTLVKGSVLIVTIMVTVYVGIEMQIPISNEWSRLSEPLLMEAVALGGLPQVMPMIYGKFSGKKSHIKGFRRSIYAGLTVCMLLNIGWCWAVLSVVPQTDPTCDSKFVASLPMPNQTTVSTLVDTTSSHTVAAISASEQGHVICKPTGSLQAAELNGLISTVPLTQMIIERRPHFRWIAVLLQIFIMTSVTVSYLTIGSAMQHTVIGFVDYVLRDRRRWVVTCSKACSPNFFWYVCAGMISFILVFLVAWSDPKGFVDMLDKIASCCLNLFAGPIIFLMLRRAHSRLFRHLSIPLRPLPCLRSTRFLLLAFFSAALVYEVVLSIYELTLL